MSKKFASSSRPAVQALLLCASCASVGSMAAERINLEQLPSAKLAAATVHARTGLTPDELRPMRSRTFANGNSATRFEQYYQGVPVWGEAIVERRAANGAASALVGAMINNLRQDLPSVQPVLDAAAVLQKAKTIARVGQSHNEQVRLFVKADPGVRARLVYLVSMIDDGAARPSRPFMLLDANSGELLERWDGIQHVDGLGPGGNSRTGYYYYEPVGPYGALDVTQSGSTCTLENARARVIDMKGLTTPGTVPSFPCFTNGARGTTAMIPRNDALAFGTMLSKMYREWLNLPVVAQKITVRINYGSSYENAFWDGTNINIGNGSSSTYSLIEPDIMGHEISHGFTEQNSSLVYSGQPGGINEAFSDMAGEALEYYRSKGSNDFLVGGNVLKAGGAIRYMCNPGQDGRSIDHASKFTTGMDVHLSSGVYNKAFCTLAKTSGWNTRKAFEVMAGANDVYWTASSSFNSAACGVERATADRGYNVADVTAAFSVVGVKCGNTVPTATPLANGGAQGVTLAKGESKLFSITVPSGKAKLTVKLSGGTGDADLYLRATTPPTTTSYTQRSNASGNTESITVNAPAAATYYILVYGYAASSGASLVATY